MKRYQPHPLAAIVPKMARSEYDKLKADIKANGLEQPITLHEGKILDGIHRERACHELGIEVKTQIWHRRNGQTPIQYVVSMNGHRRHLDAGQKGIMAVELDIAMRRLYPHPNPLLRASGDGDSKAIADALGVEARDDARDGEGGRSLPIVARAVGASVSAAEDARAIKLSSRSADKKNYERVRDGSMTLTEATRQRKAAIPKPKKIATAPELSKRALDAAEKFAKAVAALSTAKDNLTFTELWGIWATIFEVEGYMHQLSQRNKLPIPASAAEGKSLAKEMKLLKSGS